MTDPLRPRAMGASYFFTLTLRDRRRALLVEHIDALRHAAQSQLQKRPFVIEAWVVLPDHLHAVWTLPVGDTNYALRWAAIKAQFSRQLRRRGALTYDVGQGALWQRGVQAKLLRDSRDYSFHLRACHMCPVHHGYVKRADDWVFSSVHREIRDGRWQG